MKCRTATQKLVTYQGEPSQPSSDNPRDTHLSYPLRVFVGEDLIRQTLELAVPSPIMEKQREHILDRGLARFSLLLIRLMFGVGGDALQNLNRRTSIR